jgi:hypothetical protein
MKNFKDFLVLSSAVSVMPTLADDFNIEMVGEQKENEVANFVDAWNSDEFQSKISKMMKVYPNLKSLILAKQTLL